MNKIKSSRKRQQRGLIILSAVLVMILAIIVGIILLGKEELEKIFSEQENINVKCQFCNNEYDFVKEDFEEFLNS